MSGNPIHFSAAAPSDIDLVLRFMRDLYEHDGSIAFNDTRARAAVERLISCPDHGRLWVIIESERPVGYAALTLGYSLEFCGVDAFLDEIYVSSEARNRGIGTTALRFIESKCLELGVRALHLEVERGNVRAQAFYRRSGFVDHDCYLLTKRINA